MRIIKTPIEGLLVLQPNVFEDERGYFLESWNKKRFKDMGLDLDFVQDNLSLSNTNYLSFGEDLFSNSISNSLNGSIVADKTGAIFSGKHFHWETDNLLKIQPEENKLKNLDTQYRSTLSIADYFLRESLRKSKK